MHKPYYYRGKNKGLRAYRQVGKTLIYFKDNYTVYVKEGTRLTIFHRWDCEIGFYTRSWRPFVRVLKHRNKIDLATIYKIALRYDISHAPALQNSETIPSDDAIKLPSYYTDRKKVAKITNK